MSLRRRELQAQHTPEPDLLLMSEYGLRMPLWGDGVDQDDAEATAQNLGLSRSLMTDLVNWQEQFERGLATLTWDSAANASAYADQAAALLDRLRTELPHKAIESDLWPLDPEWFAER